MTIEQVQSIIETSAKANVRVIEIPGLRLEFGPRRPASQKLVPQETPEPQPTEAAISEKHEKQNEEALLADEAQVKDERLALMLIEDPLQAEQLILSGELNEPRGDTTDDGAGLDDS